MVASTITELSTEDIPMGLISGTGKRRVKIYFRAPSGSTSSTINFATYIAGLADIEGILYETDTNAAETTASTWSTTTLTISTGASGAYEGGFIGTMT